MTGFAAADEIVAEVNRLGRATTTLEARRSGTPTTTVLPSPNDADVVTIVTEGQWLTSSDLDHLRECSHDALVVVQRAGSASASVATLHSDAYRQGARFVLAPDSATELVDQGWSLDDATSAVEATDGWPDLLAAWLEDPSLRADATVLLSTLDEAARTAIELIAFGAAPADVGALLTLDATELDAALDAIEAEGIVRAGRVPSGVLAAIRAVTPPGRRINTITRLLERPAPGTVVALAEALGSLDDRSEIAASVHISAAKELSTVDASRARHHLHIARSVGAPASEIAQTAAEVELVCGNPAAALRWLTDAPPEPTARLIAASAWYALGDISAAADALKSSTLPELATWAGFGAGRADSSLAGPDQHDPAALAAAALAGAVEAWSTGDRDLALDLLGRSVIRFETAVQDWWPTTPHAVGVVLASRLGDLERAGQLAELAVADRVGGPAHLRSEVLMTAWCAVRQGRLDDAAAAVEELDEQSLTPRERWLRATVNCALALRDPDPGRLDSAVADAVAVLARGTADLYDLEFLGDMAAALQRSGGGTIDNVLAPHEVLLDRLGRPAHLDFDVAWVRLFAALSTDDIEVMSLAAHRVLAHPDPPGHHSLTVSVARVVVACTQSNTDADETIGVASQLAASGRIHEAARLCGIVAVHADDDAVTRRLLKQSREWRVQRARLKTVRGVDRMVVRLSAQEERVAHLVDGGLTYKAIAAELFISPKTVEHHVAHIRSKLGAGSRADLLSAIRAYFDVDVAASPS